jgi:hypothetical protein
MATDRKTPGRKRSLKILISKTDSLGRRGTHSTKLGFGFIVV